MVIPFGPYFSHLTPTVICAAGFAEDAIRALIHISQDYFDNKNFNEIKANPLTQREIKRAIGLARAALFPISGWAVVIKLPVSDHYVYALPKEITKRTAIRTGKGILKVVKVADKIMLATRMYKAIEITCKLTIKPCYKVVKAILTPCLTFITFMVAMAMTALSLALGVIGRSQR